MVSKVPHNRSEDLGMQQEAKPPTSFEALLADTKPQLLCLRDPLGRLLLRLSSQSIWHLAAIALAVYGVIMIGGGSVISVIYMQLGIRFLSIFNTKELPIAIFAYLVTAPLMWTFYTWQPRGVSDVFRQLYHNAVIGEPKDTYSTQTIYKPSSGFNRQYNLLISLVAVAVSLAVWLSAVYSPNNPFYFGETTLWFLLNPIYFWLLWIPLVFVNVYILCWIIIRQTVATIAYTHLFRTFQIRPKLLHPDGCNGFAPIGDYAIRSALIAVFLGFWLFVFTTYPMLFGQPINFKIDTIMLFIVYIVAVPSLLLPPVLGAHNAMVEDKNTVLEDLADQIRTLISESNVDRALTSKDLLIELQRRYEFVRKEYRTWPFRPLAIKSFGISAITPLVSTGISYLIDLYLRK